MTPVKQRIRTDPAAGTFGDCHRAAVATLLSLPLDAVPHFADGGPSADEFKRREREFLATHGLVPIDAVYAGREASVDLILHVVGALNPRVPYLLGGANRDGHDHTVVCLDDAIVHDPSPELLGVYAPCSDGWFWVTFLGTSPSKLDRRPRCGLCPAPLTPDGLCSRAACPNSD